MLHIDFETASELNLTKVGASRYTCHGSTKVIAVAWAFNDDPIQSTHHPVAKLPEVITAYLKAGGKFAAWNASFETAVFENVFHIPIAHHQAICTMQRALYAGLPAKLEKAGPVLNLSQRKDMAGHRLMMTMTKPRKDGTFWHDDPVEGPAKLMALMAYCMQDVVAEHAVEKVIPYLPADENRVSELDFKTNRRGIMLDLPLIGKLLTVAGRETQILNARCALLTGGEVTSPGTQTAKLIKWLRAEGVVINSLGKDDVSETLLPLYASTLPYPVQQVLEIRQKVAKSSVKKLQAMLNTVDIDGRVRGTLQYYGAGRTGRFSGRMIQPQNLPRPEKYANDAITAILDHDFDNEALRTFYGDPLTIVSSCLRGCLIPAPGRKFFVYDLAQIEARALAWLAGQSDVVEAFRRYDAGTGEDVYTYTANKLNLGGRTAGKVAVLGLGYGMGHAAFIDFAAGYGLTLTPEESAEIVFNWREANPMIRKFWWGMDSIVKDAIRHPHKKFELGAGRDVAAKVTKSHGYDVLLIRLPSGRVLTYRNPRIEIDPVKPSHEAIVFDGVSQYTKNWEPIRTWGSKLAENVTQAVARDIIVGGALNANAANLVLSVHDELVFEVTAPEEDHEALFEMVKGWIEKPPQWAKGLPVKAEGAILDRYGK